MKPNDSRRSSRIVFRYFRKIEEARADGATWRDIERRLFPGEPVPPGRTRAERHFHVFSQAFAAQKLGIDFGVPDPPPTPTFWPDADDDGLTIH